jgi:nickel transport protein
MRRLGGAAAGALLALLGPWLARAHEVTHEVVYGRAIAVRARYGGGDPMAYAEYQVFSPADAKIPWQKGRTDRDGWLAFVPSQAGIWRVQVADKTGHGMILSVSADAPARPDRADGMLGWAMRLAGAAAALALVFGGLAFAQRRRRSRT